MSLTELLAQHEYQTRRTNERNDGRGFQNEIEMTAGAYSSRRVARLCKVDPPTRIVGGGFNRKIIHLANPFLDFVGTWTARGGRALFIEAKSTASHRLAVGRSGGISETQLAAIYSWRVAGAATAVVWRFNGRCCLLTPEMLKAAEGRGDKSVTFESGVPVTQGDGRVLWDFLGALERVLWPQLFYVEQSQKS